MNEAFPCEGQDVNIEEGNDAIQALTRKCIGDKCYTIQCVGRLRCQIITEGNSKIGGTDAINFPLPALESSESTLEGQTFGLFKKFLPDITIVKSFPPPYPSVMTSPQQLFVATPLYPQNIYTPPFLLQPAGQPTSEIPYPSPPPPPPQVYFFPTPIPTTTTTTAAPAAQTPIVLPSPLVIAAPVQTTTVAPTARQGGTTITFGSGADPTIVISTGDASTTTTTSTTTVAPANP